MLLEKMGACKTDANGRDGAQCKMGQEISARGETVQASHRAS
jgi:hypothetical protein